jgi:hypothetical protein
VCFHFAVYWYWFRAKFLILCMFIGSDEKSMLKMAGGTGKSLLLFLLYSGSFGDFASGALQARAHSAHCKIWLEIGLILNENLKVIDSLSVLTFVLYSEIIQHYIIVLGTISRYH